MAEILPVLIVGAGPSGLTSAILLSQNGIKVRIIDRANSYRNGSRGFGLQPRTFEFFHFLGILTQVQQHATPIPTFQAYQLPGGVVPIKTWDLYEKKPSWPDRPYTNGLCLDQSILEQIMRDRLAEYGVSVELNSALTSIDQREDCIIATVTTCKNGELSEETERISAQYIIGADGAKGASRKLLGLTFQGETRDGDGMVWGDVEIDGLSNDFWHVWSQPGQFSIMMRPTSETGKVFHIGLVGQNFDPVKQANPEEAVKFIQKETGRDDLRFGNWPWISYYKPNIRIVNRFQEGRVFIIGDAGHVHSPSGGQGLNCGVQDAINLAWKLALVVKSHAPPSLLNTFNEERLPVITQMLYATSKLYTHFVAKEKPVTEVVAPVTNSHPATANDRSQFMQWRNDALGLFGVNYRYSSIMLEKRADTSQWDVEDVVAHAYSGYEGLDTLCAGDRAPEAPNLYDIEKHQMTSLFDIFKPTKHTVMIFTPKVAALDSKVLEAIQEYPPDLVQSFVICGETDNDGNSIASSSFQTRVLEDKEGHAATSYRILDYETTTIVIVRPDSHIGAIVSTVDGIKDYFKKIFV